LRVIDAASQIFFPPPFADVIIKTLYALVSAKSGSFPLSKAPG
jgi:hypothetical protein